MTGEGGLMGGVSGRQYAAAAGALFVVLFVIAQLIQGNSPMLDDDPATIAAFFHDNHRALLVAAVLEGIAVALLLTFTVGVALMLRDAGHTTLGGVALAGGVAAAAIGAVVDGIFVGITQAVSQEADLGVIRTLYDMDAFLTGRVFWVLLALVLPLLLAGWRGVLPRWTVWLNTIVAILFVLGGVSVKAQGAFSPYSAVPFLAFLAFLGFILGTSVVLWREPATGEARAAPGPTRARPGPGP
jgi:hypothetical protein